MSKTIAWIFLILVLLFAMGTCTMVHASPSAPRPNSLGLSQVYTNTNTYLFGLPVDGTIMEGATNIRFKPYNTIELYDESVLFCGDVREEFRDKPGPLVVTYDSIAHRLYHSVACHDIVSVFQVHDEQVSVKP